MKFNFELLYLLCRAVVNMMILSKDQMALVKSLYFEEQNNEHVLVLLTLLFDTITPETLEQDIATQKHFVQFITYTMRLLVLMRAIDQIYDLPDDIRHALQTLIKLFTAKFSTYPVVYKENKALYDALT